jgi:hypothetical protein
MESIKYKKIKHSIWIFFCTTHYVSVPTFRMVVISKINHVLYIAQKEFFSILRAFIESNNNN